MIRKDVKEKSRLTVEEWREYTKTVWQIANTTHGEHPSVFPVEIPHRLIKLFTFWGDTVLDPFGGVGTTARAALRLGRKAVCVDQNKRYVDLIRAECAPLNGKKDTLRAVHGDSRDLSFLQGDSVGLVVTSPPYWNKADYGKGGSNLGQVANYRRFLEAVRPVFAECYRVLQPGRKICVVTAHVNQHTSHGLLTFPLATDFTLVLRDLGFVMVNEIVWNKDGTGGKWGSHGEQRPIFGSYPYPPNFHFKNVHEYILVFAKPSGKAVRGPKVRNYEEMMGLPPPPPDTPPSDGGADRARPARKGAP
jgi:DNA modification methylase